MTEMRGDEAGLDGTRLPAALREWPRGPVIGPLALDRVKGQAGR